MAVKSAASPKSGARAQLAEYRKKRDFTRTREPSGEKSPSPARAGRLRFVIQKHAASHLHFDLRLELDAINRNNIRFRVIGRTDELSGDVLQELEAGQEATARNTGMLFNIALNYGGRAEIVDAARRAIQAGVRPQDLDERKFAEFLYTAGQPDPDLLIRTSGEMRVSNFLLWQIAYAEIWVTDTLWPDFRRRHLLEAVLAYQKRDRRYGGINPTPALSR